MTCVQWRRLRISPVEYNDSHKLELPRAWEPTCSRRPLSLGEGKSSQGFALLWKEEVNLHIQTYSPHHIDALILNNEQHPWRLTGFYGWPEDSRKKESWQLLRHLHTIFSVPWLCCGDFNEILTSSKKQGKLPKQQQPMT